MRGEGFFLSHNPDVRKATNYRGVEYRNGYAIFDPFSFYDVDLELMSTNRDLNFRNGDKFISRNPRLARKLGIEASDPSVGVRPKDVRLWRRKNGYTWHEKEDVRTLQLVPILIHRHSPHLAGVGEIKEARRRYREEVERWQS